MALIRDGQIVTMNQHYRRFSLEFFLDCQQKLGVTQIELWCGTPHVFLDTLHAPKAEPIRALLRARNIRAVSLVCPSFAYPFQCALPLRHRFSEMLRYFQNGIRLASELECGIVGVNSGFGLLDEAPGEAWKRSCETLSALAEFAKKAGVTLALESLRDDESDLVNSLCQARRMWESVNHPALKMMVDNIATGAAGESLQSWFDAFGSDLIHMHFLDGDPYVHAIWGDGNNPLGEMLRCLSRNGYKGYLVQEVADERYFSDPLSADQSNLHILRQYCQGS